MSSTKSKEDSTPQKEAKRSGLPKRVCPGKPSADGKAKCGRSRCSEEVDPHPFCQFCLGTNCDEKPCSICIIWSEEDRAIFLARKNIRKARKLVAKRSQGGGHVDDVTEKEVTASEHSISNSNVQQSPFNPVQMSFLQTTIQETMSGFFSSFLNKQGGKQTTVESWVEDQNRREVSPPHVFSR